eukprot:3799987-Rhodomonas_salina.1
MLMSADSGTDASMCVRRCVGRGGPLEADEVRGLCVPPGEEHLRRVPALVPARQVRALHRHRKGRHSVH